MRKRTIVNIVNMYQGQDCIVGGASSFIDTIDTNLLKDQLVIGCNKWGLHYPCIWNIIVDAGLNVSWVKEVREMHQKGIYQAINSNDNCDPKLLQFADVAFKRLVPDLWDRFYGGSLRCQKSVATSALHLACYMGCKRFLLLGVDFTDKYSKEANKQYQWPPEVIAKINKEISAIQSFYDVKIFQANKEAKTEVEIMKLEEFVTLDKAKDRHKQPISK